MIMSSVLQLLMQNVKRIVKRKSLNAYFSLQVEEKILVISTSNDYQSQILME